MKTNWVNDILDKAIRITNDWPAWMRRPEFQSRSEETLQALKNPENALRLDSLLASHPNQNRNVPYTLETL